MSSCEEWITFVTFFTWLLLTCVACFCWPKTQVCETYHLSIVDGYFTLKLWIDLEEASFDRPASQIVQSFGKFG